MILKARVKNFSEDKKLKLMNTFAVEAIEISEDLEQKDTLLTISTKGKSDIRSELTRFLVDPDIGLLEFTEERGELEDLFKRIHE